MAYLCILPVFKHWNCRLNLSSDFKYHLKPFLLFLRLQYNYTIFLFVLRLCHLVTPEATLKKSHQHDYLDMSQTRPKIDMPQWMGGGVKHQLYTGNHSKINNAESRRDSLPQKRAHQLIVQQKIVSPEYIQATLYTLNKLYFKIYTIHICIYMHAIKQ